jgi:hypothetical protein
MTATELLTAWSLYVQRIDRERSETGQDPRTWDANDFVAALLLRDFLAGCLVHRSGGCAGTTYSALRADADTAQDPV